jgi:hypothetical protein
MRAITLSAALLAGSIPAAAGGSAPFEKPLRFFEGRTEMISTVKVMMKKPYRSRTLGRGHILPDGSLSLTQHVEDAGKPPHQRKWRIRQVASDRFTGTMSEAVGPVTVQATSGKYRFKFKMKGGLHVEQWVTPLPDGQAARTSMTVRKMGMRVASSEGTIRRL